MPRAVRTRASKQKPAPRAEIVCRNRGTFPLDHVGDLPGRYGGVDGQQHAARIRLKREPFGLDDLNRSGATSTVEGDDGAAWKAQAPLGPRGHDMRGGPTPELPLAVPLARRAAVAGYEGEAYTVSMDVAAARDQRAPRGELRLRQDLSMQPQRALFTRSEELEGAVVVKVRLEQRPARIDARLGAAVGVGEGR